MFNTLKKGWQKSCQWVQEKAQGAALAITGAVVSVSSMVAPGTAHAATGEDLIPSGVLDQAIADIEATGQSAFSTIMPVVVTIAALLIAAKLVKRFLNKA